LHTSDAKDLISFLIAYFTINAPKGMTEDAIQNRRNMLEYSMVINCAQVTMDLR